MSKNNKRNRRKNNNTNINTNTKNKNNNNNKKNKKNIYKVSYLRNYTIVTLLMLIVMFISMNSLDCYEYYVASGAASINNAVGYEVSDNNYTMKDEANHYINIQVDPNKKSRSIVFEFATPFEDNINYTYEIKKGDKIIKTGQTSFVPKVMVQDLYTGFIDYDNVDLHVDGNFSIRAISTSVMQNLSDEQNVFVDRKKIILGCFLIYIFLIIIVTLKLGDKLINSIVKGFNSFFNYIYNHFKAILINIVLCIGLTAVVLGIWKIISLINKKIVFLLNYKYVLFALMIAIVLYAIYQKCIVKNIKFEEAFLIAGLAMGICLTINMPRHLNVSWDDQVHYLNAVAMSHRSTDYITTGEFDVYNSCFSNQLKNLSENDRGEYNNIIGSEYERAVYSYTPKYNLSYKSLVYLPTALVAFLLRGLGASTVLILIMMRMISAIFMVIMMYLGMKKLESGKLIVAAVTFIPSIMFIITNNNYDYWLIGLLAYSVCYMIGEYQRPDKMLSIKDLIIIYVTFFVSILMKPVYIPLIALAAFYPAKKFKTKKFMYIYRAIFIGIVALSVVVACYVVFGNKLGTGDLRGGEVSPAGQVKFILSDLAGYFKMLMDFLFKKFMTFTETRIYLVSTAYVPGVKIFLGGFVYAFLIVVALLDREKNADTNIKWYVNLSSIVLSFITVCFIASTMYIMFTPVGNSEIIGVQGRYLFPIFVPFLLSLTRIGKFAIPGDHKVRNYIEGSVLLISLINIIIVMSVFLNNIV
ncbi:MAG: DUF2142 domain-containing protein [Lachnospiraceae bacterium]|nr:DUF2142 domain-containing protein [Lachnospiraceae bacterium]